MTAIVALAEWREQRSGMDTWTRLLELRAQFERAADRSAGTIYQHIYHVRRFAQWADLPPPEIESEHLADYLAAHDWKPATRRAARAALRGFFTWAHNLGHVAQNPTTALLAAPARPGKPRPATDIALQSGLRAADARVRLMVRLAAYAGLRCCEIARVHSNDVHDALIGRVLHVRGKGGRERLVPLPDDLAAAIRLAGGWLFPGQIDGHLSAAHVSKLISRALPAGQTAHMLRHRFGTRAYALGGRDIRAVQELLGHASVSTTQIYTAVESEAILRAARAAA